MSFFQRFSETTYGSSHVSLPRNLLQKTLPLIIHVLILSGKVSWNYIYVILNSQRREASKQLNNYQEGKIDHFAIMNYNEKVLYVHNIDLKFPQYYIFETKFKLAIMLNKYFQTRNQVSLIMSTIKSTNIVYYQQFPTHSSLFVYYTPVQFTYVPSILS